MTMLCMYPVIHVQCEYVKLLLVTFIKNNFLLYFLNCHYI